MITAIDFSPEFAPLDETGMPLNSPLKDDQIVLNSWAADDIGATVGDIIYLTYFMPETTHGKETARTEQFTLKAIVPITEPTTPYRPRRPAIFQSAPKLLNDPDLTPYVPGVTDQESIGKWDLPFDTSASILTQGLLGAQYVGLDPGADEEFLADGDRIELTQSAVVLEQLIGQLLFGKAEGGD